MLGTLYIVLSFASPAIPNLLVHYSANPNNLFYDFKNMQYPKSVGDNVPFMLQNLSLYYAIIGIGGAFLINNPNRNFQLDSKFMKI